MTFLCSKDKFETTRFSTPFKFFLNGFYFKLSGETAFPEFQIFSLHLSRDHFFSPLGASTTTKWQLKKEAVLQATSEETRKRSHAFAIFLAVDFGFIKQTYPALTSQPETRRFISTLLPPPQDGFRLRLVPILFRPSPI